MPKFVTIQEIDIRESGSFKSSFIIVPSSHNVKWRSSLSSVRIVLTDSSVTTFGWPACDSWYTSHCPLRNTQHHFLTICMLMTSLPYTSVSYPWISAVFIFFAVKNCTTARGTHADMHVMDHSFGQSDQTKIQRCHNPKQNISPNFHSIGTVRWWGEKMANLLLGQRMFSDFSEFFIVVCTVWVAFFVDHHVYLKNPVIFFWGGGYSPLSKFF